MTLPAAISPNLSAPVGVPSPPHDRRGQTPARERRLDREHDHARGECDIEDER